MGTMYQISLRMERFGNLIYPLKKEALFVVPVQTDSDPMLRFNDSLVDTLNLKIRSGFLSSIPINSAIHIATDMLG